jgi:hypothetical protein
LFRIVPVACNSMPSFLHRWSASDAPSPVLYVLPRLPYLRLNWFDCYLACVCINWCNWGHAGPASVPGASFAADQSTVYDTGGSTYPPTVYRKWMLLFVLLCVRILTIVLNLAASTWVPICTSTTVSAPLSTAASCMYHAMVYTCPSSYLWKPFRKFIVALPTARPPASYDRANSDPSTSRQKRKRLLDQHRLVWKGDIPHGPLLLFVLLVPSPVAENLTE